MKSVWITCLLLICNATLAAAQSYDEELSKLSTGLSASLEKAGLKTVAIGGFKDLNGKETGLGKLLIEDLSVDLVNQNKGFSLVDRANLSRLMDEYKLTEEGLVNPENTKKLKLAGIDAIILGTLTPFDNTYRVQLKAIATDSAKVVAATRGGIAKTPSLDELMGIAQIGAKSEGTTSIQAPSNGGAGQPPKQRSYEFNSAGVEVQSVKFNKKTGKATVIFTLVMNVTTKQAFFYHLVKSGAPDEEYRWSRRGSVKGFEIAGAATDDQGHTYKPLLPFDPLSNPRLSAESPTTFKLEYQITNEAGSKIQIPSTFTFWFEFYSGSTFTSHLIRVSISDFPFDKIE